MPFFFLHPRLLHLLPPISSSYRHLCTLHPSSPPSPLPTSFDTASVLETLSSYSTDPSRALEFFHWVSSSPTNFTHSPDTLTSIIDILGKHLEFDLAWSLISSHPSLVSRSTFRSLFDRLASARLLPDALQTLDRSASFNLRDLPTFLQLIDSLCDHRLAPEAYDLCFKPPLLFPVSRDTKTHNLLLRGWLKMGWWSRCRLFWHEMDSRNVPKDLHSYSIYMDVVSKAGKPYKAIGLWKEMKRKRIIPDIIAYNTVIQAMGTCNGADSGVRMYREMLDSGCSPNISTFNIVVKLFCAEGRVSEGYEFLQQMKKHGFEPNVITYHLFFRHSSRPKEILWLFRRMLESECRPRMDTYVMLMKKFGRWGFLRPVFMIWRVMEENGCSPDSFAYNAFISALMQKGLVEMARRYDQEMLSKGLSPKPRRGLGIDSDADDDLGNDVI